MNVQSSKKAIELRRLGYSYTDIAKELEVSRASVCSWVKNVRLTIAEEINLQKNLKLKRERGILKTSISIRSKNVFKEKVAYENAEKEFKKLVNDTFFIFGIGLLTASGLKKGNFLQFVSQNPMIMRIMLAWIEKYLLLSKNVVKFRLFVAISHKNTGCENFWTMSLGIPSTFLQKTIYLSQSNKKGREYKGSCALTVSRIDVVRKIIAWQKLLIQYYSEISHL